MAYVRRKGNQLAIVHGRRDPESKSVVQTTLFCLYSKAEALAAVGRERGQFRRMLEQENPDLRFDWRKIEAGIKADVDYLPDLNRYKSLRAEDTFRSGLRAFTRELLSADPQSLMSSARVIQSNRRELEYIRDLIDRRLDVCDQEENDYNKDNPFYWRTAGAAREVPPEEWELLSTLYEERRHEEAEVLARLLTECWPNFAAGYNSLGSIALDRGDVDAAIEHFERAMAVGRKLFPKRIAKNRYWSDHDTRPYIRGIVNKVQALNRKGDYDEALSLCNQLETECGQDIMAALERTPIYMNSGRWEQAIESAQFVSEIYPSERFALGLAHLANGERREAQVYLLSAALKYPKAARMLAGLKSRETPKGYNEVEDHNLGVSLRESLGTYLRQLGPGEQKFLRNFVASRKVATLIEEAQEARKQWRANRSDDRTAYDRMHELETVAFARSEAGAWGLT